MKGGSKIKFKNNIEKKNKKINKIKATQERY